MNPARLPLQAFCWILFGSGFLLVMTPLAPLWFTFFMGFFPGDLASGGPGYDRDAQQVLFYRWAALMCAIYAILHVIGWRMRSATYGWGAVVLLCLSGLSGLARMALWMSGGR